MALYLLYTPAHGGGVPGQHGERVWLALDVSIDGRMDGWTDGRMDGMDGMDGIDTHTHSHTDTYIHTRMAWHGIGWDWMA